jgi:Kef-type K+ transport system membrane component KefB
MRRLVILVLLLGAMELMKPLGHNVPHSEALLIFGFLILAAYTVAEITVSMGLPKLVGYLVAGILFGPSALQTVSIDVIERLAPVNNLAIALIAFMAGCELKLDDVKHRGPKYLRILFCEMGLTFVFLIGTIVVMRPHIPALSAQGPEATAVFAILLATILAAHSPAATLALLKETRAKGPVTSTALGVVLVSDVVLILLFTLMTTVSRLIVVPSGEASVPSLPVVLWEIGGAFVVGALIGGGVALYLRFYRSQLLLFAIIVALLGSEIARLAHVELLLALLVAGFVTENFSGEGRGEEMRHSVERAAAPVFVVFFALSGATIRLGEVVAMIAVVAPIALIRVLAIRSGTSVGARWAGIPEPERTYIWTAFVAQAGVAIGLTTLIATLYPKLGAGIQTTALAVIAINQLAGPILFKRALTAAGEARAA